MFQELDLTLNNTMTFKDTRSLRVLRAHSDAHDTVFITGRDRRANQTTTKATTLALSHVTVLSITYLLKSNTVQLVGTASNSASTELY